ncbi:MAG: N-acetylmuramoyl-L-alanine amidase family protein [Brotaphodocola sp.]
MKKHIQVFTVLSAAALMCAAAPVYSAGIPGFVNTAYAAKAGWVEEDGELRYKDSDGYYLTDSWKKKDGDWYYLDEDGNTARSSMIDEYYVNEEGKRVYNQWVSVANDDEWDDEAPDAYWYYYGKDGKSVVSKWHAIDDNWYYFNNDGHMQTGKLELDGFTYYLGDENDGVMKTGWIQLENESEDPEEDLVWHYFDSKGRMVMNQVDRKIDGNYYTFENGILQTGWYKLPKQADVAAADDTATDHTTLVDAEGADIATDSNADAADHAAVAEIPADAPEIAFYQYYEADGKRGNGWYQMEGAPEISEEGETFIFYIKNGRPYHASSGIQTFTVDSKRFGFNTKGELQTGLQEVTLEEGGTANFYFGTDGVMKTGKQTIYNEDLGENQTWYFHTDGGNKGRGFHGIRDNSVYNNGLRLDADRDLRYAPAELDGVSYLVNTAGRIQEASASSKSTAKPELGTGYKDIKDANDKIWTVDVNGIIQK